MLIHKDIKQGYLDSNSFRRGGLSQETDHPYFFQLNKKISKENLGIA